MSAISSLPKFPFYFGLGHCRDNAKRNARQSLSALFHTCPNAWVSDVIQELVPLPGQLRDQRVGIPTMSLHKAGFQEEVNVVGHFVNGMVRKSHLAC